MNIVIDFPPNIKDIEEVLPIQTAKPMFCYGDTIYNPYEHDIHECLLYHEKVHSVQQGEDPAGWWKRYLEDADFRFEQELEAHVVEFKVRAKPFKDRNARSKLLWDTAFRLSKWMYGHTKSTNECLKLLKQRGCK